MDPGKPTRRDPGAGRNASPISPQSSSSQRDPAKGTPQREDPAKGGPRKGRTPQRDTHLVRNLGAAKGHSLSTQFCRVHGLLVIPAHAGLHLSSGTHPHASRARPWNHHHKKQSTKSKGRRFRLPLFRQLPVKSYYFSSESTVCGCWLACANIAVAACEMICCLASAWVSVA